MATIRKIKDRYHVEIRKKEISIRSTFSNLETAELWMKYKEDLIDDISSFDIPLRIMITLEQAIDLKCISMNEKKVEKRSVSDIENLKNGLSEWMEKSIDSIFYDDILKRSKEMMNEIVCIGGNVKNQTGRKSIQSPITVLKKIRCLSAVYSHMVDLGFIDKNPVLAVLQYLNNISKQKDDRMVV